MDMLVLDKMPVPNLYALPDWLVDEIRYVASSYNAYQNSKRD
jgi:hypothetical protein